MVHCCGRWFSTIRCHKNEEGLYLPQILLLDVGIDTATLGAPMADCISPCIDTATATPRCTTLNDGNAGHPIVRRPSGNACALCAAVLSVSVLIRGAKLSHRVQHVSD